MADQLRIEGAECLFPEKLQGDLYVNTNSMAFIVYRRGEGIKWAWLLGAIGYMILESRMQKWRDSLKGMSIDEMIQKMPGSWILPLEDVIKIEKKFPNILTVNSKNNASRRLAVPRQQDLKWFAQKRKLNISQWL